MENYNYTAIVDELVESLKERVEEGDDVDEALSEIVDGSQYVIYNRFHYQILDACKADPAEVVSDYGIDFGMDFNAAIASTVYGVLYRDAIDAYGSAID